jgi:L-ribulose-5-phosphate 3-epimerase
MMNRRHFLAASGAFAASPALFAQRAASAQHVVLHFAHRETNINVPPGVGLFDFAARIPGLNGLELQIIWRGHNLGDLSNSVAAGYKADAKRTGLDIPSISGIWQKGETIFDGAVAERAITNAIRTAEFFGARTILIALYTKNCPVMDDPASYSPVVALLQKLAPTTRVNLGLETSLSATDEKKLLTVIDRSNVRSYYDAANEQMYHPGQAISGIDVLGSRIVQCHFKNGEALLSAPGSLVDWRADLAALKRIHYTGWFVFETTHPTPDQCIEATAANIAFITQQMTA